MMGIPLRQQKKKMLENKYASKKTSESYFRLTEDIEISTITDHTLDALSGLDAVNAAVSYIGLARFKTEVITHTTYPKMRLMHPNSSSYFDHMIKEMEVVNSQPYFHEYNKHLLKEKYEEHIQKVEDLRAHKLDSLFTQSLFNSNNLRNLLDYLNSNFSQEIIGSFEKTLRSFLLEDILVKIDYYSFLNYLYILPSKKIQESDIAVDESTGKIIVFYNADKDDYNSKKITLMANEKDFAVSVMSRRDGIAKFSGLYASMFPEAYYKIESLMETLV